MRIPTQKTYGHVLREVLRAMTPNVPMRLRTVARRAGLSEAQVRGAVLRRPDIFERLPGKKGGAKRAYGLYVVR